MVYELEPEAVEYGRSLNEQALDLLLKCEQTGIYTPYNLHNQIVPIKLTDL